MEVDNDEKKRLTENADNGVSYGLNYERRELRGSSLRQTLRDCTSGPERLWSVLLYSLVAVIGSVLNGLALGYSSATLLNFQQLKEQHQFDQPQLTGNNSEIQGLFGVSSYQVKL